MRNVWRALIWDNFSHLDAMFKIYYDFPYFRRPCLRNHCVRNVWRALPFASGTPLGVPWGHRGRQGRPWDPERFLLVTVWAAKAGDNVRSVGRRRKLHAQGRVDNVRSAGRRRTLHAQARG